MEKKINIENQENQSSYTGFTKFDAPVIHTMPRRFINAKANTGDSHKGMGLLILGIGVITLIAGAVFVYFYVFNPTLFSNLSLSGNTNNVKNVPLEKKDDTDISQSKLTVAEVNSVKNEENVNLQNNVEDEKFLQNEEEMEIDPLDNTDGETIATTTDETSSSTDVSSIVITTSEKVIKEYFSAPDTDLDGLSDVEEMIFGTDKNKIDSDGDGYSDFAELKNQYNPSGDGKLIVNTGIEKYNNKNQNYSLYYPKNWTVNDAGTGESTIFRIDDLQFIQIVVTENLEKKTIEDWYREEIGESTIKNEQKVYKNGWEGVKNENGLVYYLLKPGQDKIFVLNYNVGSDNVLSYNNIFLLMIDSFEL